MKQCDLFDDDDFDIERPLNREELEIALSVIIKSKSAKISEKIKAIETACKMNGYFTEKIEHTSINKISDYTEEELDRVINQGR